MIDGSIYINRQAVASSQWFGYGSPAVPWIMMYLLLSASYKDCTWHGIKIKRGDVVTSIGGFGKQGSITDDLAISVGVIRNSLKRLEEMGEIKVSAKRGYLGYTLITVVNYDRYTGTGDKQKNQRVENNAPTKQEEISEGMLSMEEINEMFPE